MKKSSKKISSSAKRTIALAVCFVTLAQGSVFAASSSRRVSGSGKKIIEEEAAIDYVCNDLGIEAEEAEVESSGVVLENGQYVYKIYVDYDGTECIYYVRVLDGVIAKVVTPSAEEESTETEKETETEETTASSIDLNTLENEADDSSNKSSHRAAGVGKIISQREAIDYACGDLGIEAEEAEIKSADIVFDGGQYVYQVCYIYDGTEYVYNIRVYNGAVVKMTYSSVN